MQYIFLDFDRTLFDNELFYNSLELNYVVASQNSSHPIDLSKFLYHEVVDFLKLCQKLDIKCILTTYGSKKIQEFKFKGSGIAGYFVDVLYVEQGSKAEFITKYLETQVSPEKVAFIDDTIMHLEDFLKKFPEGKAIRMARLGAKGSEIVDDRFETIKDFTDFKF